MTCILKLGKGRVLENPEDGRWLNMADMSSLRGLGHVSPEHQAEPGPSVVLGA